MDHNQNSITFQKNTINMSPRPLLLNALKRFGNFTGFAVELGCGSGADTIKLVESGWKVYAVDANTNGSDNIKAKISHGKLSNLELKQEYFESLVIPDADFIYSSLSIPFCKPESFDMFWYQITNAIKKDGRFAGSFFGDKDEWRYVKDMTFKTKEQIFDLFKDFRTEYFHETTFVKKPAVSRTTKKWHIFEIIAMKK